VSAGGSLLEIGGKIGVNIDLGSSRFRIYVKVAKSPRASWIVLVQKKDGTKIVCVNRRKFNAVTITDAYPLPRVDESLDQLVGLKWFSTLDLNSGY